MVSSVAIWYFNLILIICLYIVKWLNSSICLIDGTLTSTSSLGQIGYRSNTNEGVLHIPQSSGFEPHHQMQFIVISRTLVGGCLTTLQRCSQHILQSHPTGLIWIVIFLEKHSPDGKISQIILLVLCLDLFKMVSLSWLF